ncbi:MAG: hypothetical protein RLZZ200_881 [Pseudomonadota bacterium]|jgi:flagellar hook-length control protein FliK
MAITPSVNPAAPPGNALAGASDATTTADASAAPGGFLGMLGVLAGVPVPNAAQAATQPVANLLPADPATLPAALSTAPESPLASLILGTTADETPSEPPSAPTSPEAAAAAMAVMAQMLAGTPAMQVAAATTRSTPTSASASAPASTAQPAGNPTGASVARAGAAVAPLLVPAGVTELPSDATAMPPASEALVSATLAPAKPAAPLAPRLELTDGAEGLVPPSETPTSLPAAAPAGTAKSADFQSLAALLSGERRPDAAPAGADGSRQAAFTTTLATAPVAGDAATGEAQQPVLIREQVGTAQWADSIGARLTLMATRGERQGALRLSPEHLGPVEVQIRTQDDGKTTVWFGAQHADTRAALQDSLPRLREMFAAQGMQLSDAGVFREPPRQQAPQAGSSGAGFAGTGGDTPVAGEMDVSLAAATVARHAGLLDTYA